MVDPVTLIPLGIILLVTVGTVVGMRGERPLDADPTGPGEAALCPRCGRASDARLALCSYCSRPLDHGIRPPGF